MRKLTALVLTLLLLFGLISCQKPLTPSEQSSEANIVAENDIIILFTSDVHSAVDSGWTYSGIDVIRRELIKKGNKVVLVDNGDSVQGEVLATMTDGEAIIKLMNAVGYDIAIMGNHEFDYGMDKFFELVEMADFPYISCNFNRQGEPVFESYVIKEIGGVKLAFVGITTP